jgi:protocatechuate 3,4-dioxygenase alpha subunit
VSGPTPRRHGVSGPSAAPGGSDLVVRRETASQTAGPYVHIGLAPRAAGFDIFANNFGPVLVDAKTKGERIRIEGRVFDGIGTVLKDVLIEIWQANAAGKYAHPADRQPGKKIDPHFRGWGRAATDFDSGVYAFETIKPGVVEGRNGRFMAPHVNAWIVARGINMGLNTRIYFSDEAEANAKDAVLNLIEWEQRRNTLVAERLAKKDKTGATVYRFDIRLQGENETVFFDV